MKPRYFFSFFYLVLLYFLVAQVACAYDLISPMYLETAQILPKGVSSPIYYNMFIDVQDRLNGIGGAERIDQQMNRAISWNDLLQGMSNSHEKTLQSAILKEAEVDPGGGPGATTGALEVQLHNQLPILALGVTDRWMFSLAIPIIQASIVADTGFVKNEDGQKWINKLCEKQIEGCNQAASNLNYALENQLSAMGYEPLSSKTVTALGDLVIMGRYLIQKNTADIWTLRNTVTLPTGKPPDANSAVDLPIGDGRLQLGSALLYDRVLKYDFRLNSYGGFMVLLPNQMERRIPRSNISPLSPDREVLTRNTNFLMSAGASLQRKLFLGLIAGAGYHYQYLTATHYLGGKLYSQNRYQYLEALSPAQELHSAVFTLGLSTIDWFLEKKFFYPFQAQFVFSRPLVGRNVVKADVFAAQITMFF